jgi:hypothetical protein
MALQEDRIFCVRNWYEMNSPTFWLQYRNTVEINSLLYRTVCGGQCSQLSESQHSFIHSFIHYMAKMLEGSLRITKYPRKVRQGKPQYNTAWSVFPMHRLGTRSGAQWLVKVSGSELLILAFIHGPRLGLIGSYTACSYTVATGNLIRKIGSTGTEWLHSGLGLRKPKSSKNTRRNFPLNARTVCKCWDGTWPACFA